MIGIIVGSVVGSVMAELMRYDLMSAEYQEYLSGLPDGEKPKTFEEYFPVVAYERQQEEQRQRIEIAKV